MDLSHARLLAITVGLAYLTLYIYRQIRQHRHIIKLGGYAPKVPSRLPFGKLRSTFWRKIYTKLTLQVPTLCIALSGGTSCIKKLMSGGGS